MSSPHLLTELAQFLEKAKSFILPRREETLLSVMGMGHYENPLSDLLAFFLKPQAEHGLGLLFLRSFLSCIHADLEITETEDISVRREAQTEDVKRPDIIIQCSTWLLIIEHKLWHGQNNPFESYEALAKTLSAGHKKVLYAVLSPNGGSVRKNWAPVSYPPFTATLRSALDQHLLHAPATKWTLLAEELLLHINTHILPSKTTMTDEEAQFVEQHHSAVDQVARMAQQYLEWLQGKLCSELEKAMPGQEFTTKWEAWGIRCFSQARWGTSNVVLLKDNNVRVYLPSTHSFSFDPALEQVPCGTSTYWQTTSKNTSRAQGIETLVSFGLHLNEIFPPSEGPKT
jgi:hypothetical protein